MITYIVQKGDVNSTPKISGSVGYYLEYEFILSDDWNQLYSIADNSTHKILGVSDFFGSNSLRLGVRRSPMNKDGLVAVAYSHINSKIGYPALYDAIGHPFILKFNQLYKCSIYLSGSYWSIELYENDRLVSSKTLKMKISSGLFGLRLSGIYVEVGSDPSPFNLTTYLNIVQK